MNDEERRRRLDELRVVAGFLDVFDPDDFGTDHNGNALVRWGIAEIERLDRENTQLRCQRDRALPALGGLPDDVTDECGHDHSRSSLEPARPTESDAYQRRILTMRQSWPTGDPYIHNEYTVMHPRTSDETGETE